MPLHIEVRQERSITVIQLTGTIQSHDGASALADSLSECLRNGQNELLLQVQAVHAIDEEGVSSLRRSQIEARNDGGDLKIVGARYSFVAALALHDSREYFPYYESAENAFPGLTNTEDGAVRGVRKFDILEFVKEQEKEDQDQASCATRRPQQEAED